MKLRTDFVTNSSSTSYIVKIRDATKEIENKKFQYTHDPIILASLTMLSEMLKSIISGHMSFGLDDDNMDFYVEAYDEESVRINIIDNYFWRKDDPEKNFDKYLSENVNAKADYDRMIKAIACENGEEAYLVRVGYANKMANMYIDVLENAGILKVSDQYGG